MKPYYTSGDGRIVIYHGNCLPAMRILPENSIDTVITDPPYGLKFMNKSWDHGVPGVSFWKMALRVAKPGAMLMAFGGTRTHHRLMCAIEDAGWIIRDVIMWVYGSGFPKSLDIGKAIDKNAVVTCSGCGGTGKILPVDYEPVMLDGKLYDLATAILKMQIPCLTCNGTGKVKGAEREVVGRYKPPDKSEWNLQNDTGGGFVSSGDRSRANSLSITAPATPDAQLWDGWGTALKPAWEPIILAMKPLDGTFAQNALKWGVAGLWIDGGRVGNTKSVPASVSRTTGNSLSGSVDGSLRNETGKESGHNPNIGRWPANLIHDGSPEVLACFPDSSGQIARARTDNTSQENTVYGKLNHVTTNPEPRVESEKSAARFFYCAKASKSERTHNGQVENKHPTVKPLSLLRYLCRLTRTPANGVVLDPFMGSGSVLIAAVMEGRKAIGIEINEEYCEIAAKRIEAEVKPT